MAEPYPDDGLGPYPPDVLERDWTAGTITLPDGSRLSVVEQTREPSGALLLRTTREDTGEVMYVRMTRTR